MQRYLRFALSIPLMPTVAAVVPTWNRADLIRSCVVNLRSQARVPDRILVVDNGSTDNTREIASAPGVHYIPLASNRGFAAAVNEGITQAGTDWILILNNDVILAPDWLERLLNAAEEAGADFAVGKLFQPGDQNRLDGSWDLVSRGSYAWRCGYERPDGPVWSERRSIWLAPMTAALFHRRVFDRIGLLETRFESYYEDVDFGIRCALAGFRGIYEPAATAVHLGKATLGKNAARVYFLSARNQILIIAKHYPRRTLRRFGWPILAGQFLALLAATKQGHPWPAVRGKWEALRRWRQFRDALPDAERIESVMTASEREILTIQQAIGFDIYWRLYFKLVSP